jgi:hypothetical protein
MKSGMSENYIRVDVRKLYRLQNLAIDAGQVKLNNVKRTRPGRNSVKKCEEI